MQDCSSVDTVLYSRSRFSDCEFEPGMRYLDLHLAKGLIRMESKIKLTISWINSIIKTKRKGLKVDLWRKSLYMVS